MNIRFRKKYPKRTFWTIAGLLLVLTLFSSIYFGFIITARVSEEKQRTEISRSFRELERVCYKTDSLLTSISNRVDSVLYTDSGLALLINPSVLNTTAREKTISGMNEKARGSEYIDELLLYSPVSDTVYSSRKTYVPLKYSAYSDLVSKLYLERADAVNAKNGTDWDYVYYKNNHYMVFSIRLPEFVGMMICHLNSTAVESYLNSTDPDGAVIIITEDGQLLTRNNVQQIPGDLTSGTLFLEGREQELTEKQQWYRTVSGVSGWSFITPINRTVMENEWITNIPAVLPVVLVFLLAGAVISFVSARRIYHPIERMMDMTIEAERLAAGEGRKKDELSILANVFHNALDENSKYRAYAEAMSDEITEQLLTKLAVGRSADKTYIENVLASVNKTEMMHGVFGNILVRVHSENDVELHVAIHAVIAKALAFTLRSGEKKIITPGRDEMGIVCCFGADRPLQEADNETEAFTEYLKDTVSEMEIPCSVYRSPAFSGLMNMHAGYREALEQLNYIEYRKESETLGGEEALLVEQEHQEHSPVPKEERKQIGKLLLKAQNGNPEPSQFTFSELIAQRAQETETLAEAVEYISGALYCLDDSVSKLPLDQQEVEKLTEWRKQLGTVTEAKTVQEAIGNGKTLCVVLFQLVSQLGKKNTVKYIEGAKDYIDRNYMNSLMALNDVAEYCGISPHYLSRLFTEVEGVTFVSYVSRRRIRQASQLLQLSKLSVSEIGFRCGFASVQSFCRTFKKYTGKTPGQFKGETEAGDE